MRVSKIVLFLALGTALFADSYKIVNYDDVFSIQSSSKTEFINGRWEVELKNSRYGDEGKKLAIRNNGIFKNPKIYNFRLPKDNKYKYAEIIFSFEDQDKQISILHRLHRKIDISGVVTSYMPGSICDNGPGKPINVIVELVYEDLYDDMLSLDEKKGLRWKIDGIHVAKYDGKEYFSYLLDKKHTFKAYFEGREDEAQEMSAR